MVPDPSQWWENWLSIISCGTLAGAVIPELVKAFTSVDSRHVNEVVTSAKEGGASLGILSGFCRRKLFRVLAGPHNGRP